MILLDFLNAFQDIDAFTKMIGIVIAAAATILAAVMKTKVFQDFMSGFIFNISGSIMTFVKNLFRRKKDKDGNPIKKKKKEDVSEEISAVKETDIINHDLFNYLDFWLYNQIPSIQLRTQYRNTVFRKYLHVYFKTYKDVILDFIRQTKYQSMDNPQLRQSLLKLVTDITRTYEMEMKMIGVPDVIITKMKFSLNNKIDLTMDLINSICDSSFYDSPNNHLKIYTFLNIIHSILDNTISNVEPVCNSLNGELSGLSMDGYTEPPIQQDDN